jgi:hypothetical protein
MNLIEDDDIRYYQYDPLWWEKIKNKNQKLKDSSENKRIKNELKTKKEKIEKIEKIQKEKKCTPDYLNEYKRKWRAEHREQYNEYQRQYRQTKAEQRNAAKRLVYEQNKLTQREKAKKHYHEGRGKEWYIENKERLKMLRKIRNEKNKGIINEKLIEYKKKYYQENKDRLNARRRAKSEEKKQKQRELNRKYYINNKDKIKEHKKEYYKNKTLANNNESISMVV